MESAAAHRLPVWRSAIVVWAAWAMLWLWTWDVLRRGEFHPNPLLPVACLLLICGGGLALIVSALRALATRHGRRPTLKALLIGTVPAWLAAAFYFYVASVAAAGYEPVYAILPMLPIVSSLGDVEARWRYAERTVGHRVVMFHDGIARANEIVAAADAYLAQLEAVLGREESTPVYWVRGSLIGRTRYSFGAFSMSDSHDGDLLSDADRHELAHAAINRFLTWRSRTPTLLSEGWANENMASDPLMLPFIAERQMSFGPSLSELVGQDWAEIDYGPVYSQGQVFVDDILRSFGGGKFLELYTTCRPETFDSDCRRILGVGLTELERRHAQRLAAARNGGRFRHLLNGLPVGKKVDRAAWRVFVEQYAQAVDNDAANGNYELELTRIVTTAPAKGETRPQQRTWRLRALSWKDARLLVSDDEVNCFNSRTGFRLVRAPGEDAWRPGLVGSPLPVVQRWQNQANLAEQWPGYGRWEFDPLTAAGREGAPPTVVEFRREGRPPNSLVFCAIRRETNDRNRPASMRLTFSELAGWRTINRSTRWAWSDSDTETSTDWKTSNGELVGLERSHSGGTAGEPVWTSEGTIRLRRPTQVSEDQFELAHYGVDPQSIRLPRLVPWVVLACVAIAGAQLILGFGLLMGRRGGPNSGPT
jgi:hypothetical protein